MGEALRRDCPGVGYWALRTALGKRRKVVEVSQDGRHTWVEQYAGHVPNVCDAPGTAASSGIAKELIGAAAVEHVYSLIIYLPLPSSSS